MIGLLVNFRLLGACFGVLGLGFIIWQKWLAYCDAQEIEKLGGRAPVIKTRYPFGIEQITETIQYAKTNSLLKFWEVMMANAGASQVGNYTIEVTLFNRNRSILTADPENIKALLGTTQFADYGKGWRWKNALREFIGDSIFSVDGQQWHDLRQMMRPIFNRERVADLGVFEKHMQKMLLHLGPGDGAEIDIRSLFVRYSMDIAMDFLIGTDLDSLNHPDGEFAQMWGAVQATQALILRSGPLARFIPRGTFRKGIAAIDGLIKPFVEQTLALDRTELEEKLSQSETFVHQLARYSRDEKVIRDQIITILLAGRDTTGATLSWVFYELGRNPRVVSEIRKEILDHVGSDQKSLPSYTNLKDMKYLNHVINETLRLYPIVPYNMRTALTATTLPRGGGSDGMSPVGVNKNTIILFSTLVMQRRRDLYPPVSDSFPYDPAQWVPERWETWTPKPWQFIPFSGGPRICIGQQFALLEIGYTICRIFQYFSRMDSKVDVGTEVPDNMHSDLVMTPETDVKVGLYK